MRSNHLFNVLSFDPSKVRLIQGGCGGGGVVVKKTTIQELNNIILARKYLLSKNLSLTLEMMNLNISVVEVIGWDRKILSTPYKEGLNLELLLRNYSGNERIIWVEGIKSLFTLFRSIGFLWGDFAPRNIIWDFSHNVLWLVDFERDFLALNDSASKSLFSKYVRSYSWEEFSSFLTKEEQSFVFDDFFDNDHNPFESLLIKKISSKRKKGLLERIFGYKEYYSQQEVCYVESLMVDVATPIKTDDGLFFPMDILDSLNDKGGTDAYIRAVVSLENVSEEDKIRKLKEFSSFIS